MHHQWLCILRTDIPLPAVRALAYLFVWKNGDVTGKHILHKISRSQAEVLQIPSLYMTHLCSIIWGLYVWNIKNNCSTCVFQLDSCMTINTELNTWGLLVKQGSLAEWTSKVKPMVTIPGIAKHKTVMLLPLDITSHLPMCQQYAICNSSLTLPQQGARGSPGG